MEKEGYSLFTQSDSLYTFVSTGNKGDILKGIFFQNIDPDLYNLVLMDFDFKNETFSDTISSNNGDLIKIMTTVVHATVDFIKNNPTYTVYFTGNTPSKNKLYNRIIERYAHSLLDKYVILGEKENGDVFPINIGNEYKGFYIYNK